MLARELMTSPVLTLPQDATLAQAARLLVERRISGLPIVDERGELVGILTSTDFSPREVDVPHTDVRAPQIFRRWMGPGGVEEAYRQAETIRLRDVMNAQPIVAHEDDPIEKLARLMMDHDINHVPIVRGKTVVGIVTRHDFLRLMTEHRG